MAWFTKKHTLISSLIMVFVYIVSYFNRTLNLPGFYKDFCCIDDRKLNLFLIFLPIFIFSLILFGSSELKFEKWKKFTFIYLLAYLLAYLLSPTQGEGFIWFQRETISFFGSILYLVISLILIFYKSLKKEKQEFNYHD